MHRTEMPLVRSPRLVADVTLRDASGLADDPTRAALERTLQRLDGSSSLEKLLQAEPSLPRHEIESLIESLDRAGLIDDAAPVAFRSGAEVMLEIEELVEDHCAATVFQNPFWKTCLAARGPGDLPEKLAVGMIIENWHFLFRESYFDAPVLSYVPNTAVRLLLNQFFSEEYGHDEILLGALSFAGLTREDMLDAIPLPETMAMCNALAHWAHTDPLFFFTTLGLLEGQEKRYDSFIEACERAGLPEGLVKPLKTHANINIGAAHGNLTRAIFHEIRALDEDTVARLKRQARLFVELYDNLYTGVWRYYTSDAPLLRRVRDL
jgi:hypothetical protein